MTGILRTDDHDMYSHDAVLFHEMETFFVLVSPLPLNPLS
jgi:hypothetical protein